jgi:hypothetical protein
MGSSRRHLMVRSFPSPCSIAQSQPSLKDYLICQRPHKINGDLLGLASLIY